MKIFEKIKYLLTLAVISILSFANMSCEIGLGESVDIYVPKIEIITPRALDSVTQDLVISGYSEDNLEISYFDVQISKTGEDPLYKFRWSNGWKKYENEQWVDFEEGTYSGNHKKINWDLNLKLTDVQSGQQYTINTKVYDKYGNFDAVSSEDEISVTVDVVEPMVSLISPFIRSYQKAKSAHDGYQLKNSADLTSLYNGSFEITGSQKEDISLSYLCVVIDEGTDNVPPSFEEYPNIMDYPAVYKVKQEESSRSWSVKFDSTKLDPKYSSGKYLFRIITETSDEAGNIERKVNTWFTYYNDSDKPWIVSQFGDDTENGSTIVYPSCNLQGQAIDDDGLEKVIVRTVVKRNGIWDETNATLIEYNLKDEGYPTYFNFTVTAIAENKKFKIVSKCIDKNGIESEEITRYMGIADVNPPSLKIDTPKNGESILADSKGDITITGSVSDDGEISSIQMVLIPTNNIKDVIYYYNADYDGWKQSIGTKKLFNIDWLPGSDKIENSIYSKSFAKKVNIFTDFGISANVLAGSQTLVFMAKDKSGASKIESYTLQGDIELPEISFTEINVKKANGEIKTYTINGEEIPTLEAFTRNTSQEIVDKIQFVGKWNDNSTTIWNDISKIGSINLRMKNNEIQIVKDGLTWKTEFIKPIDSTTASAEVSIKDWAGNIAKSSVSYYVSSSMPELVRISSSNYDGSYKLGDEIEIILQYNKKVTFTGSENPKLILNNNGIAIFDESSNGTSKHKYVYEVKNSDLETNSTIPKLGIKEIQVVNGTFTDIDGAKIVNPTKIPDGMNLNNTRSITIDKTSPTIQSVEPITSTGYYSQGKEIYYRLQFSEDIEIIDESGNIISSLDGKIQTKVNVKDSNGNSKNVTSDSAMKTSSNVLFFAYKIKENDFASPFGVINLNCLNCKIVDKAKNQMVGTFDSENNITTISSNKEFEGIIFDTVSPKIPVIKNVEDGQVVYDSNGIEVQIDFGSDDSVKYKKYSLDGGNSWNDYTSSIILKADGDYAITAYQEDKAGNRSDRASLKNVKIDVGKIITSLTTSLPDGTYSVGKKIPITVEFRKNVNVANTKLKLNIKNKSGDNCIAEILSGNPISGKAIIYHYEIQEGDYIQDNDKLKVEQLIGIVTDESGNDISSYCNLPEEGNGALTDTSSIYVQTIRPEVIETTFNESTNELRIKFSNSVYRGEGDIVITQKDFKAPIILTKEKYQLYKDVISDYYKETTNGADSNFKPSTTSKYVLKYEYDGNSNEVKSKLISKDADKVVVPIDSNNITIDDDVVIVKLTNAYALPVKGAYYDVIIPEGIVKDELEHPNEEKNYENKVIIKKIEEPVVRIDKKREYLNNGSVVLPKNVGVKIESQTPSAQIYYSKYQNEISKHTWTSNGSNLKSYTMPTNFSRPEDPTTRYTSEFNILTNPNDEKGYIVYLKAKATKTFDGDTKNTESEESYAVAKRTVIVFQDTNEFNGGLNAQEYPHRWIRGGNSPFEGAALSVPDFPFSWTIKNKNTLQEYCEKTRAFSKYGDKWLWMSWNIDEVAYVFFMAGDLPTTQEAFEKGPTKWVDSSCGIVTLKSEAPVYGGGCFGFENLNTINVYGTYQYQAKHCHPSTNGSN
mgnify:FL=1